jgi:hypothetical protein
MTKTSIDHHRQRTAGGGGACRLLGTPSTAVVELVAMPSAAEFAMLSSPRRPSGTNTIFSSANGVCVHAGECLHDTIGRGLVFRVSSHLHSWRYDEPETLRYEITSDVPWALIPDSRFVSVVQAGD